MTFAGSGTGGCHDRRSRRRQPAVGDRQRHAGRHDHAGRRSRLRGQLRAAGQERQQLHHHPVGDGGLHRCRRTASGSVPQYAGRLAKVQGGFAGMPAFATAPGAHHYRLQFLEIVNTYPHTDIIELGAQDSTQPSLASVAHDLIIDRCYIHGDAVNGQKRGIALNSAATTIVNSYISDIKSSQSDAQAIQGSNGPGPYLIANNYLEASGENIMFGGADPFIANLVPSDITIKQNYISKPAELARAGVDGQEPDRAEERAARHDRRQPDRKQLGRRPGRLRHPADAAESGRHRRRGPSCSRYSSRTTSSATWHRCSTCSGTTARTPAAPPTPSRSATICSSTSASANWGGTGTFLLTNGGDGIVVDHNTVFTDGTSVIYADGDAVLNLTLTNNIVPDNIWAIMGSGRLRATARSRGTSRVRRSTGTSSSAAMPRRIRWTTSILQVPPRSGSWMWPEETID